MGAFCLHHTAGCGLGHVGCLGRFSDLKAMILFRLVQFDSFDLGRGRDGCFQHAPGLMFPSNNTTFFASLFSLIFYRSAVTFVDAVPVFSLTLICFNVTTNLAFLKIETDTYALLATRMWFYLLPGKGQ